MTSRSILASVTAATTAQPRTESDSDHVFHVLDAHANSLYHREMSQMVNACRTVHGHKAGFARAAELMATQKFLWSFSTLVGVSTGR